MKGLIKVGLRCGNIVLESAWHGFIHFMYKTENCIAFKLCINDYTHSVEVVNFIKGFVLIEHLTVYAIYGFYTSLKAVIYISLLKL